MSSEHPAPAEDMQQLVERWRSYSREHCLFPQEAVEWIERLSRAPMAEGLVETVARAMADSNGLHWDDLSEVRREGWRILARAGIAAMPSIAAAVEGERERCAKVAEQFYEQSAIDMGLSGEGIAAAIRQPDPETPDAAG